MANCSPTDMAPWVAVSIINARKFTEILMYPYMAFGLCGHTLFLYTCYKQSKNNSSFLYQTFLSAVRILEIFSFAFLTFAVNRWSGFNGAQGATWFKQSVVLMWLAAHLGIPLVNSFINTSLFAMLLIIIDRLLALAKPQFYRTTWQKATYRILAFALSIFGGFALMLFDTVRVRVSYNNATELYDMAADTAYMNSPVAIFFSNFRNAVLIAGVSALWVCNAIVIRIYRSKMLAPVGQIETGKSKADLEREAKRRVAERTLFLLMVCQGTSNGIAITSLASWNVLAFGAPNWVLCMGVKMLWAPLDDAGLLIASLLDFYLPLLISKQMRRMVFPWCAKAAATVHAAPSSNVVGATMHQ